MPRETSAIRLAESTRRACVVVVANQDGIAWVVPGQRCLMRSVPHVSWSACRPRCVASRVLDGETGSDQRRELVPRMAWLNVPSSMFAGTLPMKHSLAGTAPGTVLTMLWAPYQDAQRWQVPGRALAITERERLLP